MLYTIIASVGISRLANGGEEDSQPIIHMDLVLPEIRKTRLEVPTPKAAETQLQAATYLAHQMTDKK